MWNALMIIICGFLMWNCKSIDTGSKPSGIVSSDAWNRRTLVVCWEVGGVYSDGDKDEIKGVVQREATRASFQLVGWEQCGQEADLRIQTLESDEFGPRTKGFGARLKNRQNGIILTNVIKNLDESEVPFSKASVAVHEFGHALGLMHEQNRTDSPCLEGLANGQGIGPKDETSIMSYCLESGRFRTTFSEGDVLAIKTLHGIDRHGKGGLPFAFFQRRPIEIWEQDSFFIAGNQNTLHYKARMGHPDKLDCSRVDWAATDAVDLATPLAISPEDFPGMSRLRICLVGTGSSGRNQLEPSTTVALLGRLPIRPPKIHGEVRDGSTIRFLAESPPTHKFAFLWAAVEKSRADCKEESEFSMIGSLGGVYKMVLPTEYQNKPFYLCTKFDNGNYMKPRFSDLVVKRIP